MLINRPFKQILSALFTYVIITTAVMADEITEVVNDVAAKLVQQLPMDKKIALKSLSPEETGLPEDFLRKLTSDLEAALLTASDFEINLANRLSLEDVWQEAVEFNNADFDELFKSANADVMLMMSPRAISTGVEIAITAYSLTGDDVGKTLASSGSVLLPIDLQANLGVDVKGLNQQLNTIIEKLDEKEVQTPVKAHISYRRFYGAAEISNDSACDTVFCYEDKIVAIVNGKKYVVYDSDITADNVIFSNDLDNDGFLDALIESHGGGNCCPPNYTIVSYRGEGRFVTFPLDTWAWEQPRLLQEGFRWVVRVVNTSTGAGNSNLSDEVLEFRVVDGNLDVKSAGSRMLDFAVAEFTSEEALQKMDDNFEYTWKFDFDADSIDEILQCKVWERWGVVMDCHIFDAEGSWAVVAADPAYKGSGGAQCKVISVLEEIHEGFHKLACDFDELVLVGSNKTFVHPAEEKKRSCGISLSFSTILNVQNYTNLRQQAGLNGQVIGQVPLGATVSVINPGRYLRYDRCAAACEGSNQNAIKTCIDNNDVWIEVQYNGRRGFLSRKFLE